MRVDSQVIAYARLIFGMTNEPDQVVLLVRFPTARLHRPAARLVAIDLAANLSKAWDLEVSVCQWLPAHP